MPPQKKKPAAPTPAQPAAKGKPGKKRVDKEESKNEESKNVATHEDLLSEVDEEEELVEKFGLKQMVKLDLQLPTEEKEQIPQYEMRFIDRKYQQK
jgi:hypothetical protein